MNIYTFKSLGMLGQMYVGGEEVNDVNGCDFYRVEDVARERAEYASKLDEYRERVTRLRGALGVVISDPASRGIGRLALEEDDEYLKVREAAK